MHGSYHTVMLIGRLYHLFIGVHERNTMVFVTIYIIKRTKFCRGKGAHTKNYGKRFRCSQTENNLLNHHQHRQAGALPLDFFGTHILSNHNVEPNNNTFVDSSAKELLFSDVSVKPLYAAWVGKSICVRLSLCQNIPQNSIS